MQWKLIGAACLIPASLWSQVETHPTDPGLGAGLLARWEALPAEGARKLVPAGAARLDNFALAVIARFDQPRSAAGEPAVLRIADSAGKAMLEWTITPRATSARIGSGGAERRVDLPPDAAASGWAHLVLSVQRDPRQALTGLWVNGLEMFSWAEAPGALEIGDGAALMTTRGAAGSIADARLYSRSLSRAEIQELGQLALGAAAADPRPPFADRIVFDDAETIAVLGGSDAVALIESGWWEAGLLARNPGKRIRVRSLAWETDTVFRQDRPLNFGDLRQQLLRARPTCVLLIFGRHECLERGGDGLGDFRRQLDAMLETCASRTRRIIIAGAAPFEKSAPPLPDLSGQNETLRRYDHTLKDAATRHHAAFVNVWSGWPADARGTTTDGLNLSDAGARLLGDLLNGGSAPAEALRPIAREKNMLWHQYWRPSNWAFLHGDRTAQPSSRDHLNPQVRWFPAELEKYRALIETKENELWKLANETKLP